MTIDHARIALVHDWLTGMRGGEKCLDVLCRRFPSARLLTLLHRSGSTSDAIERMAITTSFLQRVPTATRNYRYLLPLMPRAVEGLRIAADVELVLSLSHAVAKGIVAPPGVPHVCYCFTPMRYAWDLRSEYFRSPAGNEASVFSGRGARRSVGVVRNWLLDAMCDWDRATSERVTHFVAASQTVADRIRACYGRDSTVIYPPVDSDFFTPARVPREDYYLCVSALVPYKRIDLAIEACNRLGRRLVVIGRGPLESRLRRLASSSTTLLGWQSDEAIRDHLRRCRALVFPGIEDFGIVPLEAQACGTPVIALGRGGASETLLPISENVPGTAVFFDEQTVASLVAVLLRFEARQEQFDADLARQRAERFRTARFEQEIVAFLDGVLSGRPVAA